MSTAIDTISIEELDSMYEHDLVCGWCEAEAHWAWRHDDVLHFNCHECKRSNESELAMCVADGDTTMFCQGCEVIFDLSQVKFLPI